MAITSPTGERAAKDADLAEGLKDLNWAPVLVSQTRTIASSCSLFWLKAMMASPAGEKKALKLASEESCRQRTSAPVLASTRQSCCAVPARRKRPSGE